MCALQKLMFHFILKIIQLPNQYRDKIIKSSWSISMKIFSFSKTLFWHTSLFTSLFSHRTLGKRWQLLMSLLGMISVQLRLNKAWLLTELQIKLCKSQRTCHYFPTGKKYIKETCTSSCVYQSWKFEVLGQWEEI